MFKLEVPVSHHSKARRDKLDDNRLLYTHIVDVELRNKYVLPGAVSIDHPNAVLIDVEVDTADMLTMIAVDATRLLVRVVRRQVERNLGYHSFQVQVIAH